MVIVEFLREYGSYNPGNKAGFSERMAEDLIKSNIARKVKDTPDRPAIEEPKDTKAAALTSPEADKAMKSPIKK